MVTCVDSAQRWVFLQVKAYALDRSASSSVSTPRRPSASGTVGPEGSWHGCRGGGGACQCCVTGTGLTRVSSVLERIELADNLVGQLTPAMQRIAELSLRKEPLSLEAARAGNESDEDAPSASGRVSARSSRPPSRSATGTPLTQRSLMTPRGSHWLFR